VDRLNDYWYDPNHPAKNHRASQRDMDWAAPFELESASGGFTLKMKLLLGG